MKTTLLYPIVSLAFAASSLELSQRARVLGAKINEASAQVRRGK